MADQPLVTISIVSYNTKDLLEKCIRSIAQYCGDLTYKIVVVDNNSGDGSPAMIKKEFSGVELIENKKNTGFAKANNQAIRQSGSKYILLLNSDIIIVSDILTKMIAFMEGDPKTGAVGCRLLRPDLTIQPMTNFSFTIWTELLRFLHFKKLIAAPQIKKFIAKKLSFIGSNNFKSYFGAYLAQNEVKDVDYVSGACLLARREAILSAGLFDEEFFLYYEDTDLCLRIKRKGWQIKLLPYTGVIHYVGQSSVGSVVSTAYEKNVSMYRYFKKHRGTLELFLLKMLTTISLTFRNVYLLMKFSVSSKNARNQVIDELRVNFRSIRLSILGHKKGRQE